MYHGSRARDAGDSYDYYLHTSRRRQSESPEPPQFEKSWRWSPSPPKSHRLHRRQRTRSRSREDDRRKPRSVSPHRGRQEFSHAERSRRDREHRSSREDVREVRRSRYEEGHGSSSRNGGGGRSFKNDKYHWTKPDSPQHQEQPKDEENNPEVIQDLREIIKRSREETHSSRSRDREREDHADEYFKEFVPNIQDYAQSAHKPKELLSFKRSIQNDVAHEEGQFVSSEDSHSDVPYFDGTDQEITPRQFVKKIEDLGYAYGWSSSELKYQMAAKLLGAARTWFLKDELMNEPWEKVKAQFIKTHPTEMDYYRQLTKMLERTKHASESYGNYFTFKTMLMSALEIAGRRAVSCLIGGLRDKELEARCYQKNFATPELLFDYLQARSADDQRDHAHAASAPRKRALLRTPDKAAANHGDRERRDFSDAFAGKANVERDAKRCLRVKLRNHSLDAYDDAASQCVTIKEASAKHIHMDYSKRRTTIIGSRGIPVMALGDCDMRIGVDQATVNCRIYVVPNVCQDKAVVIGKSLREHQHLTYYEAGNCVVFKPRTDYSNK